MMTERNESEPKDRLLTPKQLAAFLQVSLRTIQSLTSTGVIPCVRIGRKLPRYRLDFVVDALENLRRGANDVV
ncbi:MAG: DNA-binding protein [Myxococcales bacterium]|nr:MAG: DNA-binding protein [Myxococcales bacterium]